MRELFVSTTPFTLPSTTWGTFTLKQMITRTTVPGPGTSDCLALDQFRGSLGGESQTLRTGLCSIALVPSTLPFIHLLVQNPFLSSLLCSRAIPHAKDMRAS